MSAWMALRTSCQCWIHIHWRSAVYRLSVGLLVILGRAKGGGGDSQAGRSRQGSGVPMQGDGTFLGWCNSRSAYLGRRSPRVGTHTIFTAIARELGQDGPTLGGNPAGHEYGDDPAGGCRVTSYLAASHFAGLPPPFPPPELPSVTFCVADMALQSDVSWLLCARTR